MLGSLIIAKIDMKRLMILSVVILTVVKLCKSQSRYVDIAARIYSPTVNDVLYEGDTVNIKFFILNQGPDSILVNDSLRYSLFYAFRSTEKRNVQFYQNVAPGDSIAFSDTLHMTGGVSSERIRLGFHSVPVAFSYNEKRPLSPELFEDKDDNHSSFFIRYRLLETEYLEQNERFQVYPNPCLTKMLHVSLLNSLETRMTVVSLTGQVKFIRQSVKDGDVIDLQHLNPGLYLIHLKEENGLVSTQKLIIQ